MKSSDIDSLALRLLELEQKLESYAILYDEELSEIEGTLNQLRQDILALQRERQSEQNLPTAIGSDGSPDKKNEGNHSQHLAL